MGDQTQYNLFDRNGKPVGNAEISRHEYGCNIDIYAHGQRHHIPCHNLYSLFVASTVFMASELRDLGGLIAQEIPATGTSESSK